MTALSLSELQAVNSFAALPETFYTRLAPRGWTIPACCTPIRRPPP